MMQRRVMTIAGVFLAALAGACHSTAPLGERSVTGYLLPGPHAAQAFGVDARTRLPELSPDKVPPRVVATADSLAREHRRVAACNRFFGRESTIVVVYSAFCGLLLGKEVDARTMGAFTRQGELIGEISWMAEPGIAELVPFSR
jgi:hypothetical protein